MSTGFFPVAPASPAADDLGQGSGSQPTRVGFPKRREGASLPTWGKPSKGSEGRVIQRKGGWLAGFLPPGHHLHTSGHRSGAGTWQGWGRVEYRPATGGKAPTDYPPQGDETRERAGTEPATRWRGSPNLRTKWESRYLLSEPVTRWWFPARCQSRRKVAVELKDLWADPQQPPPSSRFTAKNTVFNA